MKKSSPIVPYGETENKFIVHRGPCQLAGGRDIRVFNARGETVAFAWTAPAGAQPGPSLRTRPYTANPLFTAASGQRPAKGSVQVRIDQGVSRNSVWVRLGDAGAKADATDASTSRLPSALFDTRAEKQTISALTLQADLPPNVLLQLSLASSPDLAHWTPLAPRGPLFRFDGGGFVRADDLAHGQAGGRARRHHHGRSAHTQGIHQCAGPALAPAPGTEQRTVILWLVLLGGVGLLAGVAYPLLRQLSAPPAGH